MIAPAATPAGATSRGRVNDRLRGIGASSPHSVRRAASGQDQPLTVAVDNLDRALVAIGATQPTATRPSSLSASPRSVP
jgi:hypothetical protein